MNDKQRLVLIICACICFLMLIYPPFHINGRGLGYALIFSPPHDSATINTSQLLTQWIGAVLIFSMSWLLFRSPEKRGIIEQLIKTQGGRLDADCEIARIHANAIIQAAEIIVNCRKKE